MSRFKLKLFAAALSMAALPVFAEVAHHPEQTDIQKAVPAKPVAKPAVKKTVERKPVAPMPQTTKAMEQMNKMQDIMMKMQQTTDPAERQRLMQEHMQAMGEGMGMMRGMGGGMMMGMGTAPSSGAAKGMMDCTPMMEEMGQRMKMMEMMMDQMLKHEAARESMPGMGKP